MDEKNQQPLTLDDIVHQLTKPSVIQGQSQDVGKQVSPPSPSLPPTPPQPQPQRPVSSGEFKLPSLGGESKNTPLPGGTPSKPSDPKPADISLTIRTMAQDVDRLKRGQRPTPLEVKRTVPSLSQQQSALPSTKPKEVIVEAPIRVAPALPPRPTLPPRPSVRPFPLQASPLPQKQALPPRPPQASQEKPIEYAQEHYHREEVVGKSDDDMLPAYPGAPVPKKIVKPVQEKLQYSVIARIIGSGMTAGIVATVAIAIAGYFLLSFFVFNAEEPISSPTPTPIVQATQTPDPNELESIFRNVTSVNFSLPANQVETATNLSTFIKETEVNPQEFKKINFVLPGGQAPTLTFVDLLNRLSVRYPAGLLDAIKEGNMTFMYGQGELLGDPDSLPDPGLANKKVVLIVEVKDLAIATEILRAWELTMSEDLRNVFNIDPSKAATQGFNDNQHRGVPIRYKNFPLPDRSIDYAIVRSLAGRNYLVLTNSRESMYSPVEKITGL